ncbi:MAG TPA: SRPBCC family protein [Burkholderiales bacterium]|nr:SRPBCC family protein [Burkholderiales bacterium]
MRKIATLLMGLAAALWAEGAAADAKDLEIFHSIAIDAPADEVWAMAGDFGGIQRWSPGTESSRLIVRDRNETGAIRLLRRRSDGTQVTEKLLDYDPANRRMAYTYVDGVVRAADYFSELQVKDAGNGRSLVEWRGRFKRLAYWTDDPPAGQDDKAALDFLNGAYKTGLENLKKVLEAKNR